MSSNVNSGRTIALLYVLLLVGLISIYTQICRDIRYVSVKQYLLAIRR